MAKNKSTKEEEYAQKHIDESNDIARYLLDKLNERYNECSFTQGDAVVSVGIFASNVLASVFERVDGMTPEKAVMETRRWASIVESEVSDHFKKIG